jgi:hypothetical protein
VTDDTLLSLTGSDVVNVIRDMSRRREASEKISQVYFRLVSALNGDLDPESQAAAEKILSGVEVQDTTLKDEVTNWVSKADGIFESSTVLRSLQLSSRQDQKNVATVLKRLTEGNDRIIEKYGRKHGVWRKVDSDCLPLVLGQGKGHEIAFTWPLGLQEYFRMLPKNIVMIAGESDAGKTAWLLETTFLNQDQHDIHYFSSEAGLDEIEDRLKGFGVPLDTFRAKFYERSTNFPDVIVPTAINMIDFLEIYEDFFLMAQLIKNIWDKLTTGVAIIAIQKSEGKDYGKGGPATAEKARLYINLLRDHTCFIQKIKNWRDSQQNPNKLQRKFKILNGCKIFTTAEGWHKEDKKESDFVRER